MSDKKKSKLYKIILISVTIAYMLFIWIHSCMSADISNIESESILTFMDNIFEYFGIDVNLTNHIIRKSAHFCEFALLGFLVLWTSNRINRKIANNILQCSFVCLATATIDEIIQIHTPGRAGMVLDIVLDFSGVVFGFLCFMIIYHIIKFFIQRKRG